MTRRGFAVSLLLTATRRLRAENSVVGSGSGLDHVAVVGPKLGDLEQCYRDRLGFSLAAGSRFPTGVENAVVPFEDSPAYLELLSFYRPADRSDLAAAHLEDQLGVGGGPAFFAINCSPIEGAAGMLREHGFSLIGPKGRTILRDGKEVPAPYQIIRIDEDLIGPKASVAFIEYQNNASRLGPERVKRTRERLQRPSGELHANTARRLRAVWVAVHSLNHATEVVRQLGFTAGTDRQSRGLAAAGREFTCGDGAIVLWEARGEGALSSVLKQRGEGPFGVAVEVADLDVARRTIERNTKLQPEWVAVQNLLLPPEVCGGAWVDFVAHARR